MPPAVWPDVRASRGIVFNQAVREKKALIDIGFIDNDIYNSSLRITNLKSNRQWPRTLIEHYSAH